MPPEKYRIWGHGARRPTTDEVLATRDQLNRVRAEFLRVDLQTAFTFVKIARQTENTFRRERSCRAARRAYETVLSLAQKVDLSAKDSDLTRSGLTKLKTDLEDLGEVF
jgi:hypothetical protein